jgi:hypothetical protein
MRPAKSKPSTRPKSAAEVFADQAAAIRKLAQLLRTIALSAKPTLTENAYGGAKVRITLYSLGTPANVVCGIQPAKDGCLFYLHHITPADSAVVKIGGQGKHARQIRVSALTPGITRELRRLLALAITRAGKA